MSVTDMAATAYETASLAATAEVFGNATRWQKLVGCTPKADLSDACVDHLHQEASGGPPSDATSPTKKCSSGSAWPGTRAMLAGTAAYGLQTATSGLLQSPNFLYRVETNAVDSSNGRLKYDGLSMANRLSYLLTGGPPSAALLDAAASGQLDTADGVRTAAAPLLMNAGVADRMAAFFSEYAQAQQVLLVSKSATLFPSFNAALQSSMYKSIQLFLKNIVLAPGADVRSFYDSDQTFVDAKLASSLRRQGARVRLRPGSAPREQRTRWHPGPGRHHCGPIPARPQLSNPTRDLHPGEPPLHDAAAPSAGRQYHASWSIRRSRRRQSLEMHRANP